MTSTPSNTQSSLIGCFPWRATAVHLIPKANTTAAALGIDLELRMISVAGTTKSRAALFVEKWVLMML